MKNIIEKAKQFATAAHAGQKRKYTGEDYIVHPEHVASIIEEYGFDDNMIAAAWLHDTVEDTDVELDDLEREFNDDVTELVYWLTIQTTEEDGNRVVRKQMDAERLAEAPARAQTIKLADLFSNTISIVEEDPNFAKIYLLEKAVLLRMLSKGDIRIWKLAATSLIEGENKLCNTK